MHCVRSATVSKRRQSLPRDERQPQEKNCGDRSAPALLSSRAFEIVSKRPAENAAAFITRRLGAPLAKVPAFVRLVLVAPTTLTEAFGIDFFWLTTALTHPPAKRVVAITGIRITNFTIGPWRAVNRAGYATARLLALPTNCQRLFPAG